MSTAESSDRLVSIVSDFVNRRVLVLGDAILDEYLSGDCSRISPEAPVPVVRVHNVRRILGGAANTAANVAALGGRATLVALVGHDDAGATLARCAQEARVDLQPVTNGAPTLRKTRVVGQHQQIVRLDYEEVHPLDAHTEASILALFNDLVSAYDIVVMSDYAKGFLSKALAQQIIRRAHDAGRQVIVDPRPQHRDYYQGCDYVTPNWRESRGLLALPDAEPTPDAARAVAHELACALTSNVLLTLGPHGISFCSRTGDEQFATPTLAREVFDVSGAGDTVVATLALAIASGADHASAVMLANRAASVVVGKFGTATLTSEELLGEHDALRLVPRASLRGLAATLRAKGRRLVTVNGSFDVLHAGHLHILNEARSQGDVLIVGLNSDASVRSHKGPTRPIISDRGRAEMLLALRVVDYVHIFDEPDPIAFLSELNPDVHVNGAEYGENCIERDVVIRNGGRLHLVDRIPNLSTSALAGQL
ncbi:MAG: bifunctional heptose 7-phosphate kinase/heptose 1-phosphate adenyltransferase [Acidobacteria bacterium]|nr:MAG: bifunctional heptose 7-phosphate kinase/heptose 1-phosphate adenyltransferase [Acidobacteriota bacterium]PYR54218.1 MAG: bifunctional heptose 7-phosphate kinase/heptose 1-phosphate adenyltransferase [Acidobacteriota bacterium]